MRAMRSAEPKIAVVKPQPRSSRNVWLCAMCGFSDAGNRGSIHTRGRPASEKRQGRKSRSVVQRRCDVRYGDLAAGLELMRLDRSGCRGRFAVNRGWSHRGEGGSARCTTGFAVPVQANAGGGCELVCGRRRASGDGKYRSCRRSEERRVGKECPSKCRSRWSPDH